MAGESEAPMPTLYSVDVSPLLAESPGGTFTLDPFTVEEQLDNEHFTAHVEIRIDRTNRGVRIVGTVRGIQLGLCGRCLASATAQLGAQIDEEILESRHSTEEALLLGRGNSVDVGRIAIEALDLTRHLVLLCTPPCPERCGLCGANHPVSACPERGLDPRLAGLAALLPPEGDDDAPIG